MNEIFKNIIVEALAPTKTLIIEGGNVQIGDDAAERIDLKVHNRTEVVKVLTDLLTIINKEATKTIGMPIWNKKLFDSKKFLSGSAYHFFNTTDIKDMDFVAIKRTVGDIDTQVNGNIASMLKTFLDSSIGKMFGKTKFIGYKISPGQYISLWDVRELGIKVQIDFEMVEFDENDHPTEWSQFSHSSAWEDLNENIKGAFHKFLLQSIFEPDAVNMIIKAKTSRGKDKLLTKAQHVFSVSHGVRSKYEPVKDDKGDHIHHAGVPEYKELSTEDSNGIRDITKMYTMFFGKDAKLSDEPLLWSFVGIITLIKKYKSADQQKKIVDGFVTRLWGKGAQGLYRGEPQTDLNEKAKAIDYICAKLGINVSNYDTIKHEYYANYK